MQENDSDDDDCELITNVAIKPSGAKGSAAWDWRKDLMAVIQHKAGLAKLNAERPSTAAVGNWGILDVTQRLSEGHGLGSQVSARLFMGKKKTPKSKIEVPLSRKDSEEIVRSQWDALRYAM
jgi:hypothetical protein